MELRPTYRLDLGVSAYKRNWPEKLLKRNGFFYELRAIHCSPYAILTAFNRSWEHTPQVIPCAVVIKLYNVCAVAS